MSLRPRRSTSPAPADRPPVDEWGIYDPSQAGLEALFDRLDAKRQSSGETDAKSIAASMEAAAHRFAAEQAAKKLK